MSEFDDCERHRDEADDAADWRRSLWCDAVIAAVRAGPTGCRAVAIADAVLKGFDDAFPEFKELADSSEN